MPRAGWFPVFAKAIRNHVKFKGLSHAELGAWADLRAEAELLGDEPFVDRDSAIHVLTRRSSRDESALLIDRLVSLRLLDVDRKGRVSIHDLRDHSGRYPSEEPAAVVTRQRRSRSTRRDVSVVTTGHDSVTTGHDSLPHAREDETREDETREDETGERADKPRPLTPRQEVIAWLKANDYGEPSGWAAKPFNEMVRRLGAVALIEILDEGRLAGAQLANQLVSLAEKSLAPSRNGVGPAKGHTRTAQEALDAFNR